MSTPAKSGAKSGDRRQPRLQDIERLESKVEQLTGKVEAFEAISVEQTKALASSPLAGLTLESLAALVAMAAQAANPAALGNFGDYTVMKRVSTLMRGFSAAMTGEEDELLDGPRRRKRAEAGAKTTEMEPIMREPGETVSVGSQKLSTAEKLGLTPPRP